MPVDILPELVPVDLVLPLQLLQAALILDVAVEILHLALGRALARQPRRLGLGLEG
jgi:hypothetical protein